MSTLTGGSSSGSGYITSDSSGDHLAAVINSNIYISTNGNHITTIYIDNMLTINNNNNNNNNNIRRK